jgi:hypothetical protein
VSRWEIATGVLGTVVAVLARWLAHVQARVNELRERVARLEGADDERNRDDRG